MSAREQWSRSMNTQRPVQFEITDQTRQSIEVWIQALRLKPTGYLFPSRLHPSPHISTRQYARLVHQWITSIGLDDTGYGTHTMRRTKASLIYRRTKNLRAVQLLPGHTKFDSLPRRTMSRDACGPQHNGIQPGDRRMVCREPESRALLPRGDTLARRQGARRRRTRRFKLPVLLGTLRSGRRHMVTDRQPSPCLHSADCHTASGWSCASSGRSWSWLPEFM